VPHRALAAPRLPMTYFVSLRLTAIVLGVVYLVASLPAALAPAAFAAWSRRLVRSRVLGVVLMLLATLWFVVLTGMMDLGEISNLRVQLMAVWVVAGVLMAVFVPGLLALRGLGCLLLMGAALLLDATFLAQTPWRYLVNVLAYGWVIKGIVLVYSPHVGRNWLDWATASDGRLRPLGWCGVVLGLLLIALGIWVYPSSPNYWL
jgi:hypothetical protein